MPAAIQISARAYAVLVLLYPCEFRREFQPEMTSVFREQLEEAWAESGAAGLTRTWADALRELLTVALPMQLRNALVIASAASLVVTSIIYLALTWALTYTFHLHHGRH